jgi:hypothetical protein
VTHTSQIFLDAKALEIAAAEDDGAEVLSDGLVQTLGRRESHGDMQGRIVVEPVAIDADLFRC